MQYYRGSLSDNMATDKAKKSWKWLSQQIDRVKKHCPNLLKLFNVEEDGSSLCCLSCNTKLGKGVGFCSANCYLVNLRKFRIQCAENNGGKNICALESCDKPCYVENDGHVHDYCGKGHAHDHRLRIESIWPGGYAHFPIHSICRPYHQETHRTHGYYLRSQSCHNNGHGPILFYERGEPYYEFTNFAYYPIEVNGIRFPTSEHYFQSQKLIGTPFLREICELPRPRQAFEYPRQPHVSPWVRQDWQSIKDNVMYIALINKFTQYPELKQLLLETGDRKLVEHSPYDSYWGDGGDGKGLNRLGELLMKLRAAFRGKGKKLGRREEQGSSDRHRVATSTNHHTSDDPSSSRASDNTSLDLIDLAVSSDQQAASCNEQTTDLPTVDSLVVNTASFSTMNNDSRSLLLVNSHLPTTSGLATMNKNSHACLVLSANAPSHTTDSTSSMNHSDNDEEPMDTS